MSRGLSTEIQSRLAEGTIRPVWLVHFDFDGWSLREWTGEGNLSFDSETWSTASYTQSLPSVTESIELSAESVQISLSGSTSLPIDLSDGDKYRNRNFEMWIGFVEEDGSLPASNVQKIFSGLMSEVSYVENGEEDEWQVVAESRLINLQFAKVARYTHQSQLQLHTGDNGLEYAASAQASLFLSRGEAIDKPFAKKVVYGETKLDGSVVFMSTSGSGSRYLNLVVALAGHECESIEQVYLDDRALLTSGVVSGEFVNVVDYYSRLGTDTQTYISELETEVGTTKWNSSHQLKGICYIYLRILYSEDLFGSDSPKVSARVKGKKLYDPRTSTTYYTDNSALAVRDYLLNSVYGFSSGATEVDDALISVAANDCDYLVTKKDGSTEKRYTTNGWLSTESTIGSNLSTLLQAMAGRLSYLGGEFALFAGVYSLQSTVITDSDLVDSIELDSLSLRSSVNGARGLYKTPSLLWREDEYPPYQLASALVADGSPKWLDLSLPFTTSPSRCQRIGKIEVKRTRFTRKLALRTNLGMLNVRSGDVLSISTAKTSIDSRVYEVQSIQINNGLEPYLEMELIEIDSSVFAWDAATEETEISTPEQVSDSVLAWTLARLGTPTATPASKTYTIAFNATVSHNETGVTVRYTLDGSEPTESDSSVADGGTINISGATRTLKLKSFQNVGSLTSEVATYEYTYEAPTDLVPEPDHRWDWRLGAFNPDGSDAYPRLKYAVAGLGGCHLYNSENGGSSWSTLQNPTSDGAFYLDSTAIPSSWTPSDYRAYATKAGYIDSNQLIVPDQVIPPSVWRQLDEFGNSKMAMQFFGTNVKAYYRFATKSKSNPQLGWSTWSGYSTYSGLGWGDVIGSRFPNKTLESSSSWYQWEIYAEQSGFQDSVVIFVDADANIYKYGGEGGVSLGTLPSKPDGYSD